MASITEVFIGARGLKNNLTAESGGAWIKNRLITKAMAYTFNGAMNNLTSETISLSIQSTIEKEWEHDGFGQTSKPRKDHINANGERVKLDEEFSLGYNPRESGDPGNDINCNCRFKTDYDSGNKGELIPNSRFENGIASEVFF